MSHTVTVTTKLKDEAAIRSACVELGYSFPVVGEAQLYASKHHGFIVHIPGWSYPVVIDTKTGDAHYDNYGGKWGDQKHLDKFVQTYAIHKATLEARRRGYSVTRKTLPNGAVKLTVNV